MTETAADGPKEPAICTETIRDGHQPRFARLLAHGVPTPPLKDSRMPEPGEWMHAPPLGD